MPPEGVAMQDYVVCEKRGNHARIHVKICRHRCEEFKSCQAFQDYMQAHANHEVVMRPETRVLSTDAVAQTQVPFSGH